MIESDITFIQPQVLAHLARSALVLFVLVPILYLVCNEVVRYKARLPTLPGPRGLPLIGNIHEIRSSAPEKYRQWSKKFGAVYQIQLGNIPIVVVNSGAAAKAIFSVNSNALSSRPVFYTFHKILSSTAGTTIATSPFNDSLKRRRKGAVSALNKPSVQTYIPHLNFETREFVRDAFESGEAGRKPLDPMPLIQRLSLSLALTLNWGTRMDSRDNDLFHEITHVEDEIARYRSTTGNLADYIPLLRLNPFSAGKTHAAELRSRRDVYLKALNHDLDERIAKGTDKPCIQANIIKDKETKLNEEEMTSISLSMLAGGLDTVTALVMWAIALLAQRPDVQTKALKEIRKMYPAGEQILCDENDDMQCAYVAALVKESLRYFSVLRLLLPRTSVKDIVYENHPMPAGTTFYLNAYACNIDPAIWGSDAEEFRPERWLEQPEAPLFTYGLGYRMCGGSLLANRELYLTFMRLLSCFEILPDKESGLPDPHPIRGVADPTTLATLPKSYQVFFKPRDERLLRSLMEEQKGEQAPVKA